MNFPSGCWWRRQALSHRERRFLSSRCYHDVVVVVAVVFNHVAVDNELVQYCGLIVLEMWFRLTNQLLDSNGDACYSDLWMKRDENSTTPIVSPTASRFHVPCIRIAGYAASKFIVVLNVCWHFVRLTDCQRECQNSELEDWFWLKSQRHYFSQLELCKRLVLLYIHALFRAPYWFNYNKIRMYGPMYTLYGQWADEWRWREVWREARHVAALMHRLDLIDNGDAKHANTAVEVITCGKH